LLLFLAATGKSAQIPLFNWLPDAMEGPTPVSALIHAATMVTAGVYLLCRVNPLLGMSSSAMWVIAVIGGATAFVAATIASTQQDIKKGLAFSTVSTNCILSIPTRKQRRKRGVAQPGLGPAATQPQLARPAMITVSTQ